MARIVQSLTQPSDKYDQQIQLSFVRDVDSIVQKLNTTFQQDLKDEAAAENSFLTTGSGILQGTTITATTAFVPDESDGAALGSSSLEFSDLYLADGAVINFGDDQDITLTHAADTGLTTNGTFQATTITATTAFVPDASDGAALGTSALEFSDLFLADGAVINFGDDQDVTLTHVADAGLLLNTTMYLTFRDSALKISSSADGQLDIDADTEVEITATTVDLNGILDVSGVIVAGGQISAADGTAGAPSISNTGDLNTGFLFSAADTMQFSSGGTAQVTFQDGAIVPVTNNDIDLGTNSYEFKDAFFDGTVTADAFAGPLTGNVTGNASGTAATVTTAAQSSITSLGTLTTLTVDNVIINGTTIGHTSDADLLTLASAGLTVLGTITVGVDDTGHDVKYFGATSGNYWLWDESADGVVQIGTLTVGVDDTGHDVKFFGATASSYALWDESADSLLLNAATLDLNGTADAVILDTDGDTTISSPTDDQIDIEIAGADDFTFTANTFSALSGSTIAINAGGAITNASSMASDISSTGKTFVVGF